MKQVLLFVFFLFLSWSNLNVVAQMPVWTPDNGNGTFTNPILWGDWPDPDVIRVGDTFYFVSTSMHYVPGCPVLISKDLVNWKMAGYAVERYDEDPRYDMKGGNLYLNGSWAATIRHHNGKFYIGFCTPYGWGREKGNFSICIADHVEGPWERVIFPEYLYDPGLLFDDDGKVYVVHGQGTLYVTELNPDVRSVKGEKVKIWDQRFKNPHEFGGGFGMEGAHAYKINGKYYITCPAGGTEGWQICLRSDHIYGPYEHKLIMNDNSSYPPNGLHQGGMVELKNGDWWFIIMQDRGAIGRVPCLVPVEWIDGWPMLGKNGKDVITYRKPDVGKNFPVQVFEFPYAYVAVRQSGDKKQIVMCNDGKIVEQIDDFQGNRIWIRARATDKDFQARFYYSLDNKDFTPIGDVLSMGLGLPWTANRFALFHFTTEKDGEDGYADFNWFRFTNK